MQSIVCPDKHADSLRGSAISALIVVLVAWGALLIAGCESLRGIAEPSAPQPWVRAGTVKPLSDSESLLMYFEYVRKLSATELGKELDVARQSFVKSKSDFNRVRYAIILSLPNAPFADDVRAMEALEPLLRNPQAALHSVAFVISVQIQEQRRSRALQQKLDALKSLDKSLLQRER